MRDSFAVTQLESAKFQQHFCSGHFVVRELFEPLLPFANGFYLIPVKFTKPIIHHRLDNLFEVFHSVGITTYKFQFLKRCASDIEAIDSATQTDVDDGAAWT